MREYHKIQTIFKRCTENGPNKNRLIEGDWTKPEFEALANVEWDATEKIDGTNIRVHWDGDTVTFGGRTELAQIPSNLANYLFETFTPGKFSGMSPMTIYGEGYGAGIQKVGKLYSEKQEFIAFDVSCGGFWLEHENVCDISSRMGVKVVHYFGKMTLIEAVECAKVGIDSVLGNCDAEGLVLRAPCGLLDRGGRRLICKIKSRDFKLVTK